MALQYTLAPEDPENCEGFKPHPWRASRCYNCGLIWNLHASVNSLQAVAAMATQQEHEAQEVWPGVFLGGFKSATNWAFLEDKQITSIITAAKGLEDVFPAFGRQMESIKQRLGTNNCIQLDLLDYEAQPLKGALQTALPFLDEQLAKGNKVLVHCAQGKSRSAAIVVGYIMSCTKLNYEQALQHVQMGRPLAQPNYGFKQQMQVLHCQKFFAQKLAPL